MKLVLTTLVSQDFACYLPLYQYCAAKYLPDWHVRTFIRGSVCGYAHDFVPGEKPVEHVLVPCPGGSDDSATKSASNLCRFLLRWEHFADLDPDYVLITDADLLLFQDPLAWHLAQMKELGCYAAHHGPYKKPFRPEISSNGWRGDFERVAGGFVLVTKKWFEAVEERQHVYERRLFMGGLGQGWREMDEVILARMLKESGLPVPTNKRFPAELRGIHLGDFKDSMTHRWTNTAKMIGKLTTDNGLQFRTLEADPVWQKILSELKANTNLMRILGNVRAHLNERGI